MDEEQRPHDGRRRHPEADEPAATPPSVNQPPGRGIGDAGAKSTSPSGASATISSSATNDRTSGPSASTTRQTACTRHVVRHSYTDRARGEAQRIEERSVRRARVDHHPYSRADLRTRHQRRLPNLARDTTADQPRLELPQHTSHRVGVDARVLDGRAVCPAARSGREPQRPCVAGRPVSGAVDRNRDPVLGQRVATRPRKPPRAAREEACGQAERDNGVRRPRLPPARRTRGGVRIRARASDTIGERRQDEHDDYMRSAE